MFTVWLKRALNVFFIYIYMIQINESIVAKTTITLPVNGGAVEAVSTIETVPYWTRSRKSGENFVVFLISTLWDLTTKLIRLVLEFLLTSDCIYSCSNMG